MTPDAATRAQIAAADPSGSVWLAANAGSGKTRVLTDRVAWLLLDGADPAHILCLTYTKAAAGEMQNRLFSRLAEWAMLPDDDLRKQITKLGAARGTVPTDQLRRARTLFARAVETPGGLKVQTIHAFCASLLRRFPLEAGVSPNFQEMDEIATARLHVEILDDMAADPDFAPLVDRIAAHLTDGEPSAFLANIPRARDGLAVPADDATLRDALGIEDDSPEAVRDWIDGADTLDILESFIGDGADAPGKTVGDLVTGFRQALVAAPEDRFAKLTALCLTQKLEPRATGNWPKAVKEGDHGPLIELFTLLAERVADAHARIAAFGALARSQALHAFAPAFVAELNHRKAARGWLDFDDQIARARHLLSTADMAQWVLYKLDGGIDHILVDEAQDTAPAQWDVIRSLLAEFGAGEGADDRNRTLFVVGDRKQSIYGFQGADLAAFDAMRARLDTMLATGPAPLQDHALLHSFRSSPTILQVVDATFPEASGLGDPPQHIAHKEALPGRVDLWAPIMPEEDPEPPEWYAPVDTPAATDPKLVLARRIADEIHTMISEGVPVGADGHACGPGDVLILLRRRKDLFHHIVRACKARGLDLAGADRLSLSADLAVRDLIAALTWAATPEDDLTLAAILRSPLCGLSEADLYTLAQGRPATLWSRLRDDGPAPVVDLLGDLLSVADILRPFELLQRLLIRHDGRRRLLGRLGAESAEAIDALLGQALAYEQLESPSLTGFLSWFEAAAPELKRQGGEGAIRVMTVHGAKGLESPVVILPETQIRPAKSISGVQRLPDGLPVWLPNKAEFAPALHDLSDAKAAADAAEDDRLLYVALTRAETWLIVAAAGKVGETPEDSWHARIEAALRATGAVPHGDGLRLQSGDWTPVARSDVPAADALEPPSWLEIHVTLPPARIKPIAPSELPGAKTVPGDAADALSADAAMRRGTAIHLLLERLPALPASDRAEAARALLARHPILWPTDDADDMIAEALAVLDAPHLAHVFADDTLAEMPFALPAAAHRPGVTGTMDRVIVTPDTVTIVDHKTNAIRPGTARDTPDGLLRQLGAYAAAAAAIWPDRRVETAILWTRDATLMPIPHDVVTRAWDDWPDH